MRTGNVAAALAATGIGAAALAALQLARGDGYWSYSEGVYALTARMLLDGADLYGGIAVAQPPALFVVGAGILAIHDSIEWLRLAVGVIQLGGALLCGLLVWRLTESRPAAVVAVPLALLAPWAVHEHGHLTTDVFAGPLMIAGVLATRSARRGRAAGLIAAALASFKLPFLLPAVAIVVASADRWRTAAWAAGALAVEIVVALLVFGPGLWGNVVLAQSETGLGSFEAMRRAWMQEAWNLGGLVVAAAVAWRLRERAADRRLLASSVLVALAIGATLATGVKRGTLAGIALPVEAMLVPLAVAGVVLAVRAAREHAGLRTRVAAVVATAGVAFVLVQGVWLLADQEVDGGHPFLRAGSGERPGVIATPAEVDRLVAVARDCDYTRAYPYAPYIAFLAGRRPPADQPDGFITMHAERHADKEHQRGLDRPTCPRDR